MLVYEQLLRPCRLPWPKVRIGREGDGGYIVFDRQLEHLAGVYSYGIGADVSFDLALAHGYRLPVYQYDHTIRASPVEHDLFQFRRERGGADELRRHLTTNGHAFCQSLLLKMDIEGDEWDVINGCSADVLGQFEQIAIELHGLDREDEKQVAALQRLNALFHVGHLHGNNYTDMLERVPTVLEVTYVRRDLAGGNVEPETESFPVAGLDFPNYDGLSDYKLDWWLP